MKFILICTEGVVSEPVCVNAIASHLKAQQPITGDMFVEVVPIPVGGNQGHVHLIAKAEKAIQLKRNDQNSILSCIDEESDEIEKWLIFDYDELDGAAITLAELKENGTEAGFTLIVNKPNFEYFVLSLLIGEEEARKINPSNYNEAINRAVDNLNERNKNDRGFSDSMKIPPYSKKRFIAQDFFGRLFDNNPELLRDFAATETSDNQDIYTEMQKIVAILMKAFP